MQIVFVHYHLNAGGVTQVIVNQLRALAELPHGARPSRVGVLYGGRHEGWPEKLWNRLASGDDVPFDEVLMPLAAIDYDQLLTLREAELADEVAGTLAQHGFDPDRTLLHVHNHALGKNVSWPGALRRLADRGYRLLLQIHDFVEDFRPANYRRLAHAWGSDDPKTLADKLYPQAPGIHYATLTEAARQIVATGGIEQQRLHVLPNPVGEFAGLKPYDKVAGPTREKLGLPTDAHLVLYPVRGIRRKNLGEFLLHAAISTSDTWHAVTLAPQNPLEQPSFERWQTLADELKLRALFDICGRGKAHFSTALAASDTLLTTSVAEGFGMVFLEAWLAGKPLVGRDLPESTRDFKAAGIQFDGLSANLMVPLGLAGSRNALIEALQLAYEWACENYGVPPTPKAETTEAIESLIGNEHIDFALLPSRFQEHVIRLAAADPEGVRGQLAADNPNLDQWLCGSGQTQETIRTNADIVRSSYSLDAVGQKLSVAHQALAADPAPQSIVGLPQGEVILQQFLCVDRLHAIRFEE